MNVPLALDRNTVGLGRVVCCGSRQASGASGRQVASGTDLGAKAALAVRLTLAANKQTGWWRRRELCELSCGERRCRRAASTVRRAPGTRVSKSQRYLACEEQQRAG